MQYNLDKAAKLAVEYAVSVQPDEKVAIIGAYNALPLIQVLYREVIKAGGHPQTMIQVDGLGEIKYMYASDDQLQFVSPMHKVLYESYDCMIYINSEYNTKNMGKADPNKIRISASSEGRKELMKIQTEREAKGEFKWTIIPYPCHALAQEAGMGLLAYSERVVKALKLDKEDTIAEWKTIEINQQKAVDYLNNVKEIHVVGEDTDLTVNVEGRTWVNCCGHKNLPDGEVFTSPVDDGINGRIRFTYPGIFMGKEIEDIYLEVENGKVVKGTASKGQEFLDEILKIENANFFGEFAVGTNYGVTEFMKNMLFDEKMGGTLHMALGMALPDAGGTNKSTIHWDILKDMRSLESKIFADGTLIYEAGEWKI